MQSTIRTWFLCWRVPLLVITLLTVFAVQVVGSLPRKSLAYDEPVLIAAGVASFHNPPGRQYAYWEIEFAPLVYRLATWPLLLTSAHIDVTAPDWNDPDAVSTRFVFNNTISPYRITILSRLALLPVNILLGFLIFRWTSKLYGIPAGLTALWLFAFEPNVITGAGIVSNDLATALAFFATVWLLYCCRENPNRINLIVLGAGIGLALQAKMTALMVIPLLALMVCIAEWTEWRKETGASTIAGWLKPRLLSGAKRTILVGAISLIVLWAGYDFGREPVISPFSTSTGEHDMLDSIADRLSISPENLYSIAETPIPLGNFIRGLRAHLGRNQAGEKSYLLGDYSTHGWWYYFPVAFAVKTPLPLLLMFILSVVSLIASRDLKDKLLNNLFLLIPVLFLSFVLMFVSKNIGIRYALPIWPFIIAFSARIVTPDIWARRRWLAIVVAVLCGWQAVEALTIYPDHQAYFNQLAGGPDNGWHVLADSNIEWGQGLIELKDYMAARSDQTLHLAYFGRVDPAYYGIPYEKLRPHQRVNGIIAISVTHLLGVYGSPDDYAWLQAYEPVDKIGYGIFIYDIP